jgi:pyruvate,water dikinase
MARVLRRQVRSVALRGKERQVEPAYLRDCLLCASMPRSLCNDLRRVQRRLGDRVAVRSSLVAEDGSERSYAGQLDTRLDVTPEGILEAVRDCWLSALDERTLAYQESAPADDDLPVWTEQPVPLVAVVIQRMVDARAAGVAFGADPITGAPHVVIEAVPGLGEALVQGLAEPDHYVVAENGALLETRIATDRPAVLDESLIGQIATAVRAIGARAMAPQDVEWAWDGETLHVLQSRPITTLAGRRIYSNGIVREMSDGLIKPLIWSVNTAAKMRNVFGRAFGELIGADDIDCERLIRRIHSRVYIDVLAFGELFQRLGLPANFFEMITRHEDARRRPPLNPRTVALLPRIARFVRRYADVAPQVAEFVQRHDRALESYRTATWDACALHDLAAHARHLMAMHAETQWYTFISSLNMTVRNRIIGRMVAHHAPEVQPGDLLRGLLGLKALEPNAHMQEMAVRAASMGSETVRLLMQADDTTIRRALATTPDGATLLREFDAFIGRYGFLNSNGTDFSRTPWGEQPALIWQAIGRAAGETPALPRPTTAVDVSAIRERARAQVRARLGFSRRRLFDSLLEATMRYIDLREQASLLMSEDSYQMRRLVLAMGRCLVAAGALPAADDVFYLTMDEIQALAQREMEPACAPDLVARRKAEMAADALLELPETIYGDLALTSPPIAPGATGDVLQGLCGSSGRVEGRARIVNDPADAPADILPGDILVVPFTDVGWTPLFRGIAGVVAETGGQLSHTAIVAREYGLPAVVNVKKATRLIWEGQHIVLDADHGLVVLRGNEKEALA